MTWVSQILASYATGSGASGTGFGTKNFIPIAGSLTAAGSSPSSTTETNVQFTINESYTAQFLLVKIASNSLNASTTISTRKNAANGNLTVSVPASSTATVEDTTHSDSLVSTNLFNYQVDASASASGSISFYLFGTTLAATNATELLMAIDGNSRVGGSTFFSGINGTGSDVTQSDVQYKVENAYTWQFLGINVTASSTTASSTVTSQVGGVAGAQTLSPAKATVAFVQDTTHTDTLVATNLVDVSVAVGGMNTGSMTWQFIQSRFAGTSSDNQSCLGPGVTNGSSGLTQSAAVTNYFNAGGFFIVAGSNTESNTQMKVRGQAYKGLNLVMHIAANGVTAASTLTSRDKGANGNLVASIAASTNATVEDTTHVDIYAIGNLIDLQFATGATGTSLAILAAGMTFQPIAAIFDTLVLADATTRTASFIRTVTDNLALGDFTNVLNRVVKDTLVFADVVTATLTTGGKGGTVVDTLTFSDSTTRTVAFVRSVADTLVFLPSESVGGPSGLTRIQGWVRFPSDTLVIADLLSRSQGWARSIADTLILQDLLTRTGTYTRSPADTLVLQDFVSRTAAFTRSIADTLILQDLLSRIQGWVRSNADTLVFADVLSKTQGWLRSPADTLVFQDTTTRILAAARSLADALLFADALTRTGSYSRSPADTLVFADALTRTGTYTRSPMDALVFQDLLSRIQGWVRSTADTLIFSDLTQIVTGQAFTRTIMDTLVLSDLVSRVQGWARSNSDTLILNDFVQKVQGWFRNPSDTLVLQDFAQRNQGWSRSLADTLVLQDSLSRTQGWVRSLADTLVFVDLTSTTLIKGLTRFITDTLTLGDAVTRTASMVRTVVETIRFSDAISILKVTLPGQRLTKYYVLRKRMVRHDKERQGGPNQL